MIMESLGHLTKEGLRAYEHTTNDQMCGTMASTAPTCNFLYQVIFRKRANWLVINLNNNNYF